jgi:hypothetical protein
MNERTFLSPAAAHNQPAPFRHDAIDEYGREVSGIAPTTELLAHPP